MRKKSGSSLLEVLMATVIFCLVTLGLVLVFLAAKKSLVHARERVISAQIGKFFIDSLQDHVRQDQWLDAGPANKLAIGSWPGASQVINGIQFTETQHDVNQIPSTILRRVITKISWTEAAI